MLRSAEKGGTSTYFVPDVAYHVTKWQRGFTRAINVQGADHHSTVTRVRAGLQALDMGIPQGYPEYVLHQMVTVMRGGEEVKISKRAGSYVTVRDLIDEVGRDAVRYFFLMRKGDSQLVVRRRPRAHAVGGESRSTTSRWRTRACAASSASARSIAATIDRRRRRSRRARRPRSRS